MLSETFRVVVCGRCQRQIRLCTRCDRGRRFCPPCAAEQRRDSVRRASAAYRIRLRARRLHATRQARYRDRLAKFSAKKVTHQLVTQATASPIDAVAPELDSGGKDRQDDEICDQVRCSLCGGALPRWARLAPLQRRRSTRTPRPPRGPPRR